MHHQLAGPRWTIYDPGLLNDFTLINLQYKKYVYDAVAILFNNCIATGAVLLERFLNGANKCCRNAEETELGKLIRHSSLINSTGWPLHFLKVGWKNEIGWLPHSPFFALRSRAQDWKITLECFKKNFLLSLVYLPAVRDTHDNQNYFPPSFGFTRGFFYVSFLPSNILLSNRIA